jgi:hypothetical protein
MRSAVTIGTAQVRAAFPGCAAALSLRPNLRRAHVIILGLVLLLLGLFLKISILWTIGIIVLVVGLVLLLVGSTGRMVGGRRHYW